MTITQQLTYLEVSPKGFKLSGKTGSNFFDIDKKMRLGWFIAHFEKNNLKYLVVTNFKDVEPSRENKYGGMRAKEITKEILSNLGYW
jgi:beta-lactamase class D